MEMHQIKYFLAAADELNFTRAAEKCNVAQPSMTRAIRLLEEELGGALFNRERANTHLTELGLVMRPHLEQMWQLTTATKGLAREILGLKKTKLRLGVMCTITPKVVVSMLKTMSVNHPGIQIEILDDAAPQLVERLQKGELDAAIVCMEAKSDEALHIMPIFEEQMMVVVNPQHKLSMQNEVFIRDLDGERYLQRMNCEVAARIGKLFDEQGVNDETVCQSERDDWIIEMVAEGFGYACMPVSSISHPGVVCRPLADPDIWRKVHLVTVRGRQHTPALGALIKQVMASDWLGKKALARDQAATLPDFELS